MKPSPISRKNPLVLASASPRRMGLLGQVGIPFISAPSEIDEFMETDDPIKETGTLARQKVLAVREGHQDSWILGADTVVVLGGTVLGKPADREDACSMLGRLSGRNHQVVTGFSLAGPSGVEHTDAITTLVTFKDLTRREVEGYVDTGEPFGKAGAYAIQGIGVFMVESVSGSYSNVVGLPLCEVIKALLKTHALDRFPLP